MRVIKTNHANQTRAWGLCSSHPSSATVLQQYSGVSCIATVAGIQPVKSLGTDETRRIAGTFIAPVVATLSLSLVPVQDTSAQLYITTSSM